jgi:co-chaperonin GroES (HSP10)
MTSRDNSALAAVEQFEATLDELDQPQDQAGWGNHDIEPDVPLDLPDMLLWRVMVMPVQMRPVSKGGIEMPSSVLDNAMHLQFVGRVVRMGPLAYRSKKFVCGLRDTLRVALGMPIAKAPKVGDWVVYGRYAGQKTEFRGSRYLIMNDDEILGIANAPEGFRVYV